MNFMKEKFLIMPAKYNHKNNIAMIEGALCIALSIVLSNFTLFRMPQDGSIDFELVPLMIFAYRRGLKHGLIAGFLVGLLKILLGGYVLNFVQAVLDYPLAFMCAGLIAVKPKILGFLIAACGQISCSVVSGAYFFSQYAPEGQNAWVYSLLINVPVLGLKYLISFIAALILWKALEKQLGVRS